MRDGGMVGYTPARRATPVGATAPSRSRSPTPQPKNTARTDYHSLPSSKKNYPQDPRSCRHHLSATAFHASAQAPGAGEDANQRQAGSPALREGWIWYDLIRLPRKSTLKAAQNKHSWRSILFRRDDGSIGQQCLPAQPPIRRRASRLRAQPAAPVQNDLNLYLCCTARAQYPQARNSSPPLSQLRDQARFALALSNSM